MHNNSPTSALTVGRETVALGCHPGNVLLVASIDHHLCATPGKVLYGGGSDATTGTGD